jgi:hypothetical protein
MFTRKVLLDESTKNLKSHPNRGDAMRAYKGMYELVLLQGVSDSLGGSPRHQT